MRLRRGGFNEGCHAMCFNIENDLLQRIIYSTDDALSNKLMLKLSNLCPTLYIQDNRPITMGQYTSHNTTQLYSFLKERHVKDI